VIEWYTFREKANNLKIRKIDKFANVLKRDMQAVRNAIVYEYNNGIAEGSVNKLKVIKRIMYGRNKFEMLRQKVLLLENNG
jgi:transposase